MCCLIKPFEYTNIMIRNVHKCDVTVHIKLLFTLFVCAVPINMENKNTKMFSSRACTVFSFHKYPSKVHIHEVREVENIIFLPWQYKYPLGNISREIVRCVYYIASYLLYPQAVTASYRSIQRPFLSVCY